MEYKEFINEIRSMGGSISFPGRFTASFNELIKCIEEPELGSIKEYVILTQVGIGSTERVLDHEEMRLLDSLYAGALRWSPSEFYNDGVDEIRDWVRSEKLRIERESSYESRRERASLHTSDRAVRRRILNRDGNKCLHCGATEKLSLDHIIPVIQNGGDEDENLQTLCISCNSRKGGS